MGKLFPEAPLGPAQGLRRPQFFCQEAVKESHEEVCRAVVHFPKRDQHGFGACVQDASGQAVFGYRAASFSIGRANLWALDTLVDAGFRYDSSLFPIVHDRYGIPGAERRIHELTTPRGQPLIEIPLSTVSVLGMKLPVGGGGYLRIFPLVFTRWAFRRLNREGTPAIVYVHPWEVDPDQPRLQAPPRSRFRHYTGLRTTASKLRELTSTFRFGTLRDVLVESGLDPFPEQSVAAELTS